MTEQEASQGACQVWAESNGSGDIFALLNPELLAEDLKRAVENIFAAGAAWGRKLGSTETCKACGNHQSRGGWMGTGDGCLCFDCRLDEQRPERKGCVTDADLGGVAIEVISGFAGLKQFSSSLSRSEIGKAIRRGLRDK